MIEERSGKLIALEGDADTIATQLRLLPPSQKILVLPSVLEKLSEDCDEKTFNAQTFVREVHTAFTDRTESARTFLQLSTSTQPRLVFMNGGSVAARTACISRICENVTNGDIVQAEAIYNEIVKDGVSGLMKLEENIVAEENIINEEDVDDV